MKYNGSLTTEQVKDYLGQSDDQRMFARYRDTLLDADPCFSPDESARLIEITRLNDERYSKRDLNKLLIDLSWASSHLEGNTYTQLDTMTLISYGIPNDAKSNEDAVMIMNHKRAIEFMISQPSVSMEGICRIHALLADSRMAPGSRHFLPPEKCGVLRSYTEGGLAIMGSSYLPPQVEDRGPRFIEKEFKRLVSVSNELPDPINQSFYLMTRIPYLQVFEDVNKRTARISCNVPLLGARLAPLSFVGFAKSDYLAGLLAVYELGDERLAKDAFLGAYLSSAFRFLKFSEEATAELAVRRDVHIAAAKRYVMTGERDEAPVWLRTTVRRARDDYDAPSM